MIWTLAFRNIRSNVRRSIHQKQYLQAIQTPIEQYQS
jgi:hypothetical protein